MFNFLYKHYIFSFIHNIPKFIKDFSLRKENYKCFISTGCLTHKFTKPIPSPATYQKVENEMKKLAVTIKNHELSIEYLKAVGKNLDKEIADCKIALGKAALSKDTEDASPGESEDVIIKNILKYENSAAAIFCGMKYRSGLASHPLIEDVIGVVAMLGTTDDPRLSSVLSEYLGLENMLSLVCKTWKGVQSLESYNKDGSIDKTSGIHALAADVRGIYLDGRFQVYCLDNLRSYAGRIVENDPHRRLDLAKPILNGETPTGFLGFAVNMVLIDSSNMYCMLKAGNTLRETLFYNLFSTLQVYKSRADMLKAETVISHGAVSLDGGMIHGNGDIVIGEQKRDIAIKFLVRPRGSEESYELDNKIMKTTCQKRLSSEALQREQELLDRAKSAYEVQKTELINVLASGLP